MAFVYKSLLTKKIITILFVALLGVSGAGSSEAKADIFSDIGKGLKTVGKIGDTLEMLFPRGNPDDGGHEMGIWCERRAKVAAEAFTGTLSKVKIAAVRHLYRDEAIKAIGTECEPHWYWLYARALAAMGDVDGMHIAIHRAAQLTNNACLAGTATPLGPVLTQPEAAPKPKKKKKKGLLGLLAGKQKEEDKKEENSELKDVFKGLYTAKYAWIAGLQSKYTMAGVKDPAERMQSVVNELGACFPDGELQRQSDILAPFIGMQQDMLEHDQSIDEIAGDDEAFKEELIKFKKFQETDTASMLQGFEMLKGMTKLMRARVMREFRIAMPHVRQAWREYKSGDKELARKTLEQNSPFFSSACRVPEEEVVHEVGKYQIEGAYKAGLVLACDLMLEGTNSAKAFKENVKVSKDDLDMSLINLDPLFGKAMTRVRGKHIYRLIKARNYMAQGQYDKAFKNISKYLAKRIEKFHKFQTQVKNSEIPGLRMPLLDPTSDQLMLRLIEVITTEGVLSVEQEDQLLDQTFTLLQLANPKNEAATMIEDLLAMKMGGEIAGVHSEIRDLTASTYGLERDLSYDFIYRYEEIGHETLAAKSASFVNLKKEILKKKKQFTKLKKERDIGLFDNPFSLKEFQAALKPNEGVIVYFNDKWLSSGNSDQMYGVPVDLLSGMLVTRDAASFVRLPAFFDETVGLIKRLRRSLSLDGASSLADVEAFDFEASYQLYDTLIAPFEPHLGNVSSLTVVAEGELLSLPFSTLVSEIPDFEDFEYDRYSEAKFIAKRLSFRTVPSVRGFMSLQATAEDSRNIFTAFLGVGDPELDGKPASLRSGDIADVVGASSKMTVNEVVKKLPALPATARELTHIASLLDGGLNQTLLLRNKATEEQLFSLHGDDSLKDYSLITFATHGLLAGEIGAFDQPALVMTPLGPERARDGLLTPREIIDLSFDAQLMVLSACNTAGANGKPGGQPLSGLATAFFHSGVERLLVSHWPVDSSATASFNSSFIGHLKSGASVSDALAKARVSMMHSADNVEYGHPAFWAAFDLVGAE